jgi:hypothetical protein
LFPAVLMVAHGRGERQRETLALAFTQGECVGKILDGLEAKSFDRFTQFQELVLGLPYQCHEDSPLTSTTAAKAPHNLCEFLREVARLALELGGPAAALLGDVGDDL